MGRDREDGNGGKASQRKARAWRGQTAWAEAGDAPTPTPGCPRLDWVEGRKGFKSDPDSMCWLSWEPWGSLQPCEQESGKEAV